MPAKNEGAERVPKTQPRIQFSSLAVSASALARALCQFRGLLGNFEKC